MCEHCGVNEGVRKFGDIYRCSNCGEITSSDSTGLLCAADDYISILERKIRSLDPYSNMMPWDRPKDTDIAGAKGKWLAAKSIAIIKGT